MNRLEDQAPFVPTAVSLAIAACSRCWPRPRQDVVQWPSLQRLLAIDIRQQLIACAHVAAHVRMSVIVHGWGAVQLANRIALALRTERDSHWKRSARPMLVQVVPS